MKKYINKITSEFEEILLELSEDSRANYWDAKKKAEAYAKDFSKKKSLNKDEYRGVLEICNDIIQDWFPDISSFESQASFS